MNEWFADEALWEVFGDCMFHEQSATQAVADVHCIQKLSQCHSGDVLDLACGPGRHVCAFAQAGFTVTGLDLSAHLLGQAQSNLKKKGLSASLQRADMRTFALNRQYDLIVNLWTSFGYFEDTNDDQLVLQQMFTHLKTGGVAIIDIAGKDQILRDLQPVHVTDYADGSVLMERPILTEELGRYENEWTLIRDGQAYQHTWTQNLYTAREMRSLFAAAGFCDVMVYGGLDGCEYDMDAQRLVVVGRKP